MVEECFPSWKWGSVSKAAFRLRRYLRSGDGMVNSRPHIREDKLCTLMTVRSGN